MGKESGELARQDIWHSIILSALQEENRLVIGSHCEKGVELGGDWEQAGVDRPQTDQGRQHSEGDKGKFCWASCWKFNKSEFLKRTLWT